MNMRKIYLVIFLISLSFMGISQSQRRVFIEEGTNASCSPCASQNPAFDALLLANSDKVAVLKYHWYFPGTDPMNAQNPDENNGRVAYYGINGVPTAIIDGVIPDGSTFGYAGSPAGFTQALIDEHYNTPSPLNMSVYQDINTDNKTVDTYILLEATGSLSGSLKAHVAVVEKQIHFNSAPGSNGEKDFYDVLRKMVPDMNGSAISNMEAGDYSILHTQWDYTDWTIYDEEQLAVVSWVQSGNTKTVYQSQIGSSEMFEPVYEYDAEITKIIDVPESTCTPFIQPQIELRNNGSENITSLDIEYYMNEGESVSYSWTGNLGFLESEIITLPGIDFVVLDVNEFHVNIVSINGTVDEYEKNNNIYKTVNHSVKSEDFVRFIMRTDNKPEETTWEVTNGAGEVVYSGGPYTQSGQMINEMLSFDEQDCYMFSIYDSGDDGICCENGTGFFALSDNTNSSFVDGGNFGSMAQASFTILKGVGIDDVDLLETGIFPNPANRNIDISVNLTNAATVQYFISDLAGRDIIQANPIHLNSGQHTLSQDISDLIDGVYLVKIVYDNRTVTKKIVVKH